MAATFYVEESMPRFDVHTTLQIELRTTRITSEDVKSVHNNLSNNGNNMDHVSIER